MSTELDLWIGVVVSVAAALMLTASAGVAKGSEFRSEYERSGGTRVGDAVQAEQLSEGLSKSTLARGETIGKTSEGRPIIGFEIGPHNKKPIVLIGGIHAGEVEGSIALLQFVRDVAASRIASEAHAWIVPYISPDGSADLRFFNRPNQNGPSEVGFRANAAGLNLNRDFIKVETPEIRSLLKLVSRTQPVLVVDFHTTDGAKFASFEVGLQVPKPNWARSAAARSLNNARDALLSQLVQALTRRGIDAWNYYPDLVDNTLPSLGLVDASPRMAYSDTYFAGTGRLGILVEVNAYTTLARRLNVARQVVLELLDEAGKQTEGWAQVTRAAREDLAASVPGSKGVEVDWDQGDQSEMKRVTFLGLTRRTSKVTGGVETVYEGEHRVPLNLPYYSMKPVHRADAPPITGGYVVAGGFAPLVRPILHAHNLGYCELDEDAPLLAPKWFKTKKVEPEFPEWPEWPIPMFKEQNLEGHLRVKVSGAWTADPSEDFLDRFHRGALFVPIEQPGALVVMALFEPQGADSIVSWGLVNTVWERHEFVERHRAVLLAEKALAGNHGLIADPDTKDGDKRLRQVLYKAYPDLFRRVGWIPLLKVAGIARRVAKNETVSNDKCAAREPL